MLEHYDIETFAVTQLTQIDMRLVQDLEKLKSGNIFVLGGLILNELQQYWFYPFCSGYGWLLGLYFVYEYY